MSLRVYRTLKQLTQLAGVGLAVYSIHQGADPLTVYALAAAVISGPEAIEHVLANGEG